MILLGKLYSFADMSASRTLKKFLKENNPLCGHSHTNVAFEWFVRKYGDQKKVKIPTGEHSSIVISDEGVEYEVSEKFEKPDRRSINWCFVYRLMLNSADYCEYCRDKRRRFWEEHQEIIERLPRDAGKFVMNLPMIAYIGNDIALSDTKLVYKYSEYWYISGKHEDVDADELLREFRKEYNVAKIPKFSAKCWRFADVSVRT